MHNTEKITWPKVSSFNIHMTLLRRLTVLSPQRPGFDPSPVHVEFVVDKLGLKQVSLWALFSPVSIIPWMLHTHSLARSLTHSFKHSFIQHQCYTNLGRDTIVNNAQHTAHTTDKFKLMNLVTTVLYLPSLKDG